jgi:hypothetical protein
VEDAFDYNVMLQARMLEELEKVEAESALSKMYIFSWEDEAQRATYQPIEFTYNLSNSDEFNHCFTPTPINRTD